MKKEASGKKGKKLWLIIAIAVLVVAAAVVALLFLLPGSDDDQAGASNILYWNVDREANTDRDTGLSIREPAEDGYYYIRFAHSGKQVEIPVADKKLVNYIDSLDLMGLVLDENGFAIDVKPITDMVSVIGEGLYVQSVSGDTIVANSSIMMNGRRVTIKLTDKTAIYNVSGKGEFVGEALDADKLNPMDTISIYGTIVPEDSEEDPVVTHIYVLKKPVESKIYWRAERDFYNSTTKETTRVPDENGVYTIKFFVDGETVDLKCKDKELVSYIDSASYYWTHWGLEFDEDGYIIDYVDSFLGSRTLMQCERFDITEINEDGSYVASNLIKNNGASVQGVIGADCPIYDVSSAAWAEGEPNRKIDTLKLGDRVCIWTDTMGNPVLVYVAHRLVDSPAYWNVTRKWDSTLKQTSRVPNEQGIYEIELLPAGGVKTMYYTDDINLASAIDQTADYVVGLRVGEGNVIECVYDMESVFGYTYLCRGYYITDYNGTIATYLSAAGSGYTRNGVLASTCRIYNVSAHGTYGEETDFQFGDLVYSCKTPIGEVASAYITRRYLGEQHLYWNLERKWDSTNKVTTRTPDADGYYVFNLVQDGKFVTAKTKDIEVASTIDSYSAPGLYIKLDKNGVICDKVLDGNYATGGTKWASRTVVAINGEEVTLRSSSGSETTFVMTDDIKVTNVSATFKKYKGELSTLQVGDYVNVYRDIYCNIRSIYIRNRETSYMAWAVDQQYDSATASTKRVPDADGYYRIPLAVDGKVKTYKTKYKDVASAVDYYSTAFGVELSGDTIVSSSSVTYVKGIKGIGINNYVVESVSGNNLTAVYTLGSADKTGTKETVTLTSNTKVIDVSPAAKDAGTFGQYTKVKYGDTIRVYLSDEGEVMYLFITAHFAREGKIKSYCPHCKTEVYWNAYTNASSIPAYDTHFYLPSDVELVGKQISLGNTTRDFEMVLDLNGHTLFRDGGRLSLVRRGETFSIIDSVGGGVMKTKNNTSNGGVFMVSGGSTDGIGTLNIYGGTYTLEKSDNETLYGTQGGIITNTGGVVNLYDGVLKGGHVFGKTSSGATGGNVRISGGTFNMYGGKLIAGTVDAGTYERNKKDADGNPIIGPDGKNVKETVPGSTGHGGNIYASGKAGVANIYGGEIIDGSVSNRGGNIYVGDGATVNLFKGVKVDGGYAKDRGGNIYNGAILNIEGAEILNGQSEGRFGGNIMCTGVNAYIYMKDGKVADGIAGKDGKGLGGNISMVYSNLIMTGGEIVGGTAETGGNIYATESGGNGSNITISGGKIGEPKAGGTLYLSSELSNIVINGGTIEGTTTISKAASFKMAGKPVISKLRLGGALLIELGEMSKGASVTLDRLGVFTTANAKAASYKGYFKSIDPDMIIDVTGKNELKIRHQNAVVGDCVHCDGQADWIPWDGNATAGAHYFLTGDLQLTEEIKITADNEFVLDLKGYTLTAAADSRVFYTSGDLVIMDSSDAKTGLVTGGTAGRGGNLYITETGSFTLYSGTIANGNAVGGYTYDAADVNQETPIGVNTNGRGGNIFTNGNVTLLGGAVIDGQTTAVTAAGKSTSTYGGNIMATGSGIVITVAGDAVVSGGVAKNGNSISLMYSNLVVKGGTVVGTPASGNLIEATGTSSGGASSITISGGTVSGGTIGAYGNTATGDVKYPDYRTALNITGGNLDCTLNASKASELNVSGNVQIKKLTLGEGVLVNFGKLEDGANVVIDGSGVVSTAFGSKADAQAAAPYVAPLSGGLETYITEANELAFRLIPTNTQEFYCEKCKQTLTFNAWLGGEFYADGHYYLESDINLGSKVTVGHDIVLDLNGYSIYAADGNQAFSVVGGTLAIQDTSAAQTGKIIGSTTTSNGGTIYVSTDGKVELYSGTITGGKSTRGGNIYLNAGELYVYGGAITDGVADNNLGTSTTNGRGGNIFSTGNVYILGGSVTGGTCIDGSNYGGNIMVTNMGVKLVVGEGAVISGGTASTGDEIALMYSNVEVNGGLIDGGIYTNGTNTGGYSTVTINGGEITGTVTLSGGQVNVQVDSDDNEYYVSSGKTYYITREGDSVYYGTVPGEKKDDLYLDYRTVLNITGGTVNKINVNGKASGDKINVSGATVINNLILGDALIDATGLTAGASITVDATDVFTTAFADKAAAEAAMAYFTLADSGLTLAVTDAFELTVELPEVATKEIFCQHCQQNVEFTAWAGTLVDGGHFFLEGPVELTSAIHVKDGMNVVFDLNGQTITANGTRAFFINGGTNPTLSIQDSVGGGVITGGTSGTSRGGNIYASSGNLNLYGGTIVGGTANADNNMEGHNIAVYGGAFYMNGNVVIGDADKDGHSLYLFNTTSVEMVKGTITGKVLARTANFELKSELIVDALSLRGTAITAVEERNSSEQIIIKVTNGDGATLTGEFTSALTNASTVLGYFKTEKAGCEIIVNGNGKLEVAEGGSVTPPPVVPDEPEGDTKTVFCQHCQQEVEFVKMELVDSQSGTDYTLSTGHYFLAQDVELTKQIAFGSNKDVVVDLNGKTITATGCRAFYLSSGATLSIQGEGTITGGTSTGRGGNIYATGANVSLYGGTIVGGTATISATNDGHNVTVYNGAFVMNGDVVIGDADKDGHSLYLFNTTSVEMTKGTIVGKARLRSANFALKKDVTFDLLALQTTKITAVEERTGNKIPVKVTNNAGDFLFSNPADTENPTQGLFTDALDNAATALTYFEAAGTDRGIIVNAENKLEVIEDTTGDNPGGGSETPATSFCPHCEQEVEWTEWAGQTESGHYYLAADKVLTAEYDLTGSVDVVIDLRGFDITGDGIAHIFDIREGAVLSVCDTVGGGVVSGANNTEGSGGNVYVHQSTFNLYSGTIANGHALKRGGNIYVTSASVNIYGGSVIDGTVDEIFSDSDPRMLGGNIFVMNGNLSVSGDAVISNTTDGFGEAIYLRGNATPCEFVVTGGTIDGEVVLHENFAKAEISGKAVVSEITVRVTTKQALITKLGAFEEGAYVAFNNIDIPFTAPNALVSEADLAYINTIDPTKTVALNASNELVVVDACVCGCGAPASEVVWVDANAFFAARAEGYAEMPAEAEQEKADKALRRTLNEDIHLRLSADLDITALYGSKSQIVQDPTEAGCNVTIDLNGYTWSTNHRFYIYKNSTLTICDTSAEGTGVYSSTGYSAANSGGCFYVAGTLNICGGTLTQPVDGGVSAKGGVVYVSGGVANFYDGTITGGQAAMKDATTSGMGGNVYVHAGTFNMYGGSILNGSTKGDAGVGGNVYLRNTDTAFFNMYGGIISGGTASDSAEIFVGEKATFVNEGGIVGTAPVLCACGCGAVADDVEWVDANAYFAELGAGYTELTDAAVKKTKRQLTTNMHLKLTADMNIADLYGTVMQIEVGNSTTPVKVTLDLNGFTWTSVGQRGIYIEKDSELTILDSSAEGTGKLLATGKSGTAGRAIANYGTFNLRSGTLGMAAEPLDVNNGGVVYQSKGVFNMYGGTISGGASTRGGNVYINSGAFNMYGGEIKDGTAAENGANVYLNTGVTFVKEAGTIADEATTVYQKPAA